MSLFGPSLGWKCDNCGKVYRSNPQKCKTCNHTVFGPQRRSGVVPRRGRTRLWRSKRPPSRYYCTKCAHVHDRKPFVCDECGASTIAPYDVPGTERSGSGAAWTRRIGLLLFVLALLGGAYVIAF